MPSKIIDAHFHLWNLAREDYWWFRDMPALNRNFMEGDYQPLRAAAGIEKAIIVQALESSAETEFMLDLAEKNSWISGVIGWVDFNAEDARRELEKLAQHKKLVGIRNWAVGKTDVDWLGTAALDHSFSALIEAGITYDALVGLQNLPALIKRFKRNPSLKLCINHFAYPLPEWSIGGREETHWQESLRTLAMLGAAIKLSGFGHRTNGTWQAGPYDRFVEFVLRCFEPTKIIWASNWPTVVKECSFEDWLIACQNWTAHMNEKDRTSIFSGAAQAFYRI